jgi:hypothetical protein
LTWMQFVAAIVEHVAWPAVVVFLGALFKDPVRDLFSKLKALKYGDSEAHFHLPAMPKDDPPALPSPAPSAPLQLVARVEEERDVDPAFVTASPNGAVLGAWVEVERALRRAARRLKSSQNYADRSVRPLIVELKHAGVLDKSIAETIEDAFRTRSQVAHGEGDVSRAFASQFVNVCESLVRIVDRASDDCFLKQALKTLGVDSPGDVVVRGYLRKTEGGSASIVRWEAKVGDIVRPITEDEARALIQRGARYLSVPADDLG